jgi:hypothetical protein
MVHNVTGLGHRGARVSMVRPTAAPADPVGKGEAAPASCAASAAPLLSVTSVLGPTRVHELVVAVAHDAPCGGSGGKKKAGKPAARELRVYEALLPYFTPQSDHDISWLRMPLLAGGLVMVFAFQVFNKKKARGGGGGGGRGMGMGGGPSGSGEFDNMSEADFRKIAELAGGGGMGGMGDMAGMMAGMGGAGGGMGGDAGSMAELRRRGGAGLGLGGKRYGGGGQGQNRWN